MRTRHLITILLLSGVAGPAAAQFPPVGRAPQPPVPRGAERVVELEEDVRLLRFLGRARQRTETLEALLDILEPAQEKLRLGDQAAASELVEAGKALPKAKATVAAGERLDSPTDEEIAVATVRARLDNQRRGFLTEVGQEIRQLLETLSPEERAALLAAAAELVRERRANTTAPVFFGGGAAAAAREMDQLRGSSPEDYERARLGFALRSASVQNWWAVPGMIGGPGGPAAFALRVQGGGGDAPPPVLVAPTRDASIRGFGPQGEAAMVAAPPDLNDPRVQGRLRPFMNMADQARGMPPALYQQQRERLAQQVDAARQQARIDLPVSDEEALDAVVEAMLRPRMPGAIKAKLGKG